MSDIVVLAENLTKLYEESSAPAVDGIGLSVASGSVVGLVGPNGAGKTTTLQMLAGAMRPSRGRIEVFGRPFGPDTVEAKARLGYVPSDDRLFEHLTGEEQILLSAVAYSVPLDSARVRLRELLDLLDLGTSSRRPIREYSHGMKRKVALASVLVHDPDVVFLDEPLEGIDVPTSRALKDVFRLMADRGRTLILTSHNLPLVADLCPRVVLMHRAHLLFDGPVWQLERVGTENGRIEFEEAFMAAIGDTSHTPCLSWLAR